MKEKQYNVTLDVFLMEYVYVTASSKKEAIQKAKQESRYAADGAELKVFEVEEDK